MNEDNYEFNGLCKEVFLMIISPDLNVFKPFVLFFKYVPLSTSADISNY